MTLAQLLEALDFDPELLLEETQEREALLYEANIEIHQQPSYPLKGQLDNVVVLDGQIAFASGTASEYGDKKAWDEPDYF